MPGWLTGLIPAPFGADADGMATPAPITDRRADPRTPVDRPCALRVAGRPGARHATLVDTSAGGLGIELLDAEVELPVVGSQVEVFLEPGPLLSASSAVHAVVARMSEHDAEPVRLGLRRQRPDTLSEA